MKFGKHIPSAGIGLVFGTSLVLGAGAAHATLLVDGDFSQGISGQSTVPGWTITGNMAIFSSATSCCHTGSTGTGNFVNIGGGDGPDDGVIAQTFATVAGQTYVLSFLYGAFSSPEGVGTQSIEVTAGDLDTTIVSNLSVRDHGDVLSSYQLAFDATAASTTLTFTDRSTITRSIDGILDSVTVEVPEPGSIAVLGSALLGLAWLSRNRRARPARA